MTPITSPEKFLTPEERNAIAFFSGTGTYRNYQRLETRPNIFDTRETFLLKMHDHSMRYKFLNSLQLK